MAFNFLERLGSMLGQRVAERVTHRDQPAEAAAPAEAPPTEAVPEAAPSDAPVAEAAPTYEAPAATETAPDSVPAVEEAPYVPVSERAWNRDYSTPPTTAASTAAPEASPAVEPVAEAPAAPAEPAKSAEEIEEERLWAETDAAWGAGDFQKVTECLDALKALQPEDAAEIDEKIAAAQYNQASAFEQSGDLNRALYLYQEAQRRNPNLGEATFAVERVQQALNPPAPPAEEVPQEQTYTVADGDTLWAIAERYYGDGSQYTRIFGANRDQLDNPDVIQAGQVLRIPA
jgi:nucleoid-associated protein YgaU